MKILAKILLFFVFISFFSLEKSFGYSKVKYFRVTAYYSPLPNQNYYLKGTYKKEKKLNGEGIIGASGKKVFSGMLAGPKKYKFGTKIYLEGLGVGEIADRGGAIVRAGKRNFKFDRIDVWVGYGDEGLRRALYWGNRVVKGKIVSKNSRITINYKKIPSPYWTIYKLKKNQIFNNLNFSVFLRKELKIFNYRLRTKNDVKVLQERLSDLGLYRGKIDGNYEKIRNIIINYQIKNKIISYIGEAGTGYFGPKTRAHLKNEYKNYLLKQEKNRKKIESLKKELQILESIYLNKSKNEIKNLSYLKKGDISYDVRKLQQILIKLGYFNYKDTAIYGNITYNSVLKYQIDKNIVKGKKSSGAGCFGPRTKKQLIKDYSKYLLVQSINNNKELVDYYNNSYVFLENKL